MTGSVLERWESGRRRPQGRYLAKARALLGEAPGLAPTAIGEQLKHRREQLGLTLRAMATRLGVVQSTLCRWESGEREPQSGYLERVERELNLR